MASQINGIAHRTGWQTVGHGKEIGFLFNHEILPYFKAIRIKPGRWKTAIQERCAVYDKIDAHSFA